MQKNKAIGSIVGFAIGDALGAPVEFKERGTFEPVEFYRSGGKFNLPAGAYTDDTAMTLCLAQSLLDKNGCNADEQLQRVPLIRCCGYHLFLEVPLTIPIFLL